MQLDRKKKKKTEESGVGQLHKREYKNAVRRGFENIHFSTKEHIKNFI